MPYNPYSPYPSNPYGQPMYGFPQPGQYAQPQPQFPQPQQPQENVYAFVNGVEGAKSYQVRPNQSVMLMDSEQPLCYMKQSNAMGQASVRYFRLTEISEADARGNQQAQQAPSADFVTRSDFDALSKRVSELAKSVSFRKQQAQPSQQQKEE